MTDGERRANIRSFLGQMVTIVMDRPIGTKHTKNGHSWLYPINYGYLTGILGGDGEEQDVYLLGVKIPVKSFTARVIGIVHRLDNVEDKLIAAPDGMSFTAEEMAKAVAFQEQYHQSEIEVWNSKQ